jgi:four helix bundle protein
MRTNSQTPKDPNTQGPNHLKKSSVVDFTDAGSSRGEEEFWADGDGSALHEEFNDGQPYDLEERTARFGEAIIRFAKRIPRGPGNNRLIDQLVGAATSVGANYCEADEGVSRKDFKKSIGTCKKEARETKFFLRMVATAEEDLKPEARRLWIEAKQLHLIFCSLYRK